MKKVVIISGGIAGLSADIFDKKTVWKANGTQRAHQRFR